MRHVCHALDCHKVVPPKLLMCARHWSMVEKATQAAVYKHYRVGQCDDLQVTNEWHYAASRAIDEVAHKEGKQSNREEVVRGLLEE